MLLSFLVFSTTEVMCIANLIFKHASLAWMLYIFCLCVPKCKSLFIDLVWKEQIILINIESSFWQSEDILLFHSEVFCPFFLFSSSESIVYVMSQFSVLYIHRILPHDFFFSFPLHSGSISHACSPQIPAFIFYVISSVLYWLNIHFYILLSLSLHVSVLFYKDHIFFYSTEHTKDLPEIFF